jgi:hypothetical protein
MDHIAPERRRCLVELLARPNLNRPEILHAARSIVDEPVERAEAPLDRIHRRLNLVVDGRVGKDGDHAIMCSALLRFSDHRLSFVCTCRKIEDRNIGAGAGKGEDGTPTSYPGVTKQLASPIASKSSSDIGHMFGQT